MTALTPAQGRDHARALPISRAETYALMLLVRRGLLRFEVTDNDDARITVDWDEETV